MPRYPVLQKGFYDGKTYDPKGKRRVLVTDKPFPAKGKPSWVGEPLGEETPAQRKKREKAEAEAADKQKQDQVEKDAVTFAEAPKPTIVETL